MEWAYCGSDHSSSGTQSPVGGAGEQDSSSYMTASSSPPKRRTGRTKFKETRHPVYKGVRSRNPGRWVCEVREPHGKQRIWLSAPSTPPRWRRARTTSPLWRCAAAARASTYPTRRAGSGRRRRCPLPSHDEIRRADAPRWKRLSILFRPGPSVQRNAASEAAVVSPVDSWGEELVANCPYFPMVMDGLEFEMQGYLDMAQGMLIQPPPMAGPSAWVEEEYAYDCDVSLWIY